MSSEITQVSRTFKIEEYVNRGSFDPLKALEDRNVSGSIELINNFFYSVSIAKTIKPMGLLNGALKLAYAGSKGFKSNVTVLEICSRYQTFVNQAILCSKSFSTNSTKALKFHLAAVKMARKNELQKALSIVSKSGTIATEMVATAAKLVSFVDALRDRSREALVQAATESTLSSEKKAALLEMINTLKSKEKALSSKSSDLADCINEERMIEKKAAQKADLAQKRAFILSLVSCSFKAAGETINGLGNVALGAGNIALGASKIAVPSPTIGLDLSLKKDNSQPPKTSSPSDSSSSDNSSALIDNLVQEKEAHTEKLDQAKTTLAIKKDLLKKESDKDEPDKEKIENLEKEIITLTHEIEIMEKNLHRTKNKLSEAAKNSENVAESYFKQEASAAQRRYELQKEQREVNAELAESLEKLKTFKVDRDDLDRAIVSLDITVKMLGVVKTVFENIQLFWQSVELHSKSLTEYDLMELYAEPEFSGEFLEEVNSSRLNWLAVFEATTSAQKALQEVKQKSDDLMMDLPTTAESRNLLESSSVDQFLHLIKSEQEELELIESQSAPQLLLGGA